MKHDLKQFEKDELISKIHYKHIYELGKELMNIYEVGSSFLLYENINYWKEKNLLIKKIQMVVFSSLCYEEPDIIDKIDIYKKNIYRKENINREEKICASKMYDQYFSKNAKLYCKCGVFIGKKSYKRHLQSKKHLSFDNIRIIKEYIDSLTKET
jgi:hypothetical protein